VIPRKEVALHILCGARTHPRGRVPALSVAGSEVFSDRFRRGTAVQHANGLDTGRAVERAHSLTAILASCHGSQKATAMCRFSVYPPVNSQIVLDHSDKLMCDDSKRGLAHRLAGTLIFSKRVLKGDFSSSVAAWSDASSGAQCTHLARHQSVGASYR